MTDDELLARIDEKLIEIEEIRALLSREAHALARRTDDAIARDQVKTLIERFDAAMAQVEDARWRLRCRDVKRRIEALIRESPMTEERKSLVIEMHSFWRV